MRSFAQALQDEVLVLDGGLATELERQGHDLSSALWSARLLVDEPRAIVAAHQAFRRAGAQVATTASYQASLDGFRQAGYLDVDARAMLRRSVELARTAIGDDGWVAASVGPYGAVRSDGSEYRGDYGLTVAELRRFHRPRLQVLAEAAPDVLAVETIPCLDEVEALLAELADVQVPAWLSVTCAGDRTRHGEPAAAAFAMAADLPNVVAAGVNCTAPADVPRLIATAAGTGRPVVAYPNSAEHWDAGRRVWTGRSRFDAGSVAGWIGAGARLVGGCCRVGPDEIADVAGVVGRITKPAGDSS